MGSPAGPGLYDPRNEHDSCGVGFVVNIKGRKSHDIIRRGLQILVNLDHRGAVGADPLVGDGAGCLIQMPDALLRDWAEQHGLTLPPPGRYAVAMCFLPQDAKAREFAIRQFEHFIAAEGPVAARLARRADRHRPGLGQAGDRDDAGDPPGDRRGQPESQGPGRVRAQDPDHPQADPEQRARAGGPAASARAQRALYAVVLHAHGGLQGPAAGAAGRHLLPGPAQPADPVGAGAGASALLHQHLPVLAAGASVPLPGA